MFIPRSVLIIDDDPILCEISRSYFDALGVSQIQIAGNGRQALAFLKDDVCAVDFVLCDLNMPELDGIQLLGKLRETGFAGHIAIVSGEEVSVIETAKSLAKAYGLNIAGVVKKPLRGSILEQLLTSCQSTPASVSSSQAPALGAAELATAVTRGQIVPYYLPTVDIKTGAIIGVEALARWQHPERGLIMPDDFIPAAEQTGTIDGLTNAMLVRSLADMVAWRDHGIRVEMALNLTSVLLNDKDLPDRLTTQLAKHGIEPSLLTLEVTERIILEPSSDALEVLARLRIKGFNLAIDDFGTGFSNIEQLRSFPYSRLKIDRSFVQGAASDRFAIAGLKASIMLGRELNMMIIAEGIAGHAEWFLAKEHGVDHAQGFWIAEPMPTDDFAAWYTANSGFMPQSLLRQARISGHTASGAPAADPFSDEFPASSQKRFGH